MSRARTSIQASGLPDRIGLESLSLATLLVPGAQFWNVGPSASTRLFDRRQLRENLVVQSERQEQAARSYETAVLRALQEVEDSLTDLAQEQIRRGHLAAAANAAQQAADLSLQLYNTGLRDFRDVLDAQRSLLTLQDSLASSDTAVSSDLGAALQSARRRMERNDDAPRTGDVQSLTRVFWNGRAICHAYIRCCARIRRPRSIVVSRDITRGAPAPLR